MEIITLVLAQIVQCNMNSRTIEKVLSLFTLKLFVNGLEHFLCVYDWLNLLLKCLCQAAHILLFSYSHPYWYSYPFVLIQVPIFVHVHLHTLLCVHILVCVIVHVHMYTRTPTCTGSHLCHIHLQAHAYWQSYTNMHRFHETTFVTKYSLAVTGKNIRI